MMYAGGEIAFALLDLVLVATGVYVFLNKKTYAHRYLPGWWKMVAFIIFPLAYTISIAFTNYSGANLLSLEHASAYHLKKTYKVKGGEYDFSLLDRGEQRYQLLLRQDGVAYISNPMQLWTNADLKKSANTLAAKAQIKLVPFEGDAPAPEAPIQIAGHKSHLSAMTLLLPDGTQLSMTGMRKFAAQKPLFTHLQDGFNLKSGIHLNNPHILRNNETGQVMLPNMETGYFQYVNDEGVFVGEGFAPGFVVNVGWKNFLRVLTDPGIQGPFLQIFVWTVIFAACSSGLYAGHRYGSGVPGAMGRVAWSWFLSRHADPALCGSCVYLDLGV